MVRDVQVDVLAVSADAGDDASGVDDCPDKRRLNADRVDRAVDAPVRS